MLATSSSSSRSNNSSIREEEEEGVIPRRIQRQVRILTAAKGYSTNRFIGCYLYNIDTRQEYSLRRSCLTLCRASRCRSGATVAAPDHFLVRGRPDAHGTPPTLVFLRGEQLDGTVNIANREKGYLVQGLRQSLRRAV
jgi:hypothetical protein